MITAAPQGTIAKAEVSLYNGTTIAPAQPIEPNIERAGVCWQLIFGATPTMTGIMPRATDDKENRQPTISEQQWNARSYLFGAAVPHPTEVVN